MSDEPKRLYKILEAASYTGFSKATLYLEAKAGNLKLIKIGGATRIEKAELDRWIDAKIAQAA